VNWKKTFLANAEIAMEPSKAVKETRKSLLNHKSRTSAYALVGKVVVV